MPATLQAAIAARIDRLDPKAKRTLSAAAVIGSRFGTDLLAALGIEPVPRRVGQGRTDRPGPVHAARRIRIPPSAGPRCGLRIAAQIRSRATASAAGRRDRSRDPESADENAALIAEHLEAAGDLHAAYRWHMRAAEWLRPRDVPAARARWESARCAADRLPDDHNGVVDMRLAPRTMLISTALYVGDDVDIDGLYGELRDLTMQTGDFRSLALATAGRIQWFALNHTRVPEAASLATDLEEMATGIDCDAATKSILLNAVVMARFLNCEFEAALQVIDEIAALAHEVPAVEIALARAIRGSVEICLGDYELGRRHLRESVEQGHALPPVVYAQVLFFSGAMVVLGMSQADDLVDDVHEALRRAEEFGDISGIMAAQYSYGMTLLRAEGGSPDEALDVLERLRTDVEKHKMFKFAAATLDAVLEIDAARKGKLDEAIDVLRASFALHMSSGSRVFVGCPGEALVGLLIERGSTDDLAEAHRIVDQWQTQRLNIPALDLWWLKSRALLAEAEGNSDYYTKLANQYLQLCEKLDARGRLSEARRMVNEIDVMATILAYTSPALGHLLPISALLAELSRRGHTVHVRTLSTGVEIGQRLGFAADAIDPRIEEIEHDDWKATNPVAALKRSVAVFTRRAAHEVSDLADAVTRVRPDAFARGCELLGRAVDGRGRSYPMGLLFAVHAAAEIARCPAIWAWP